MDKNTLEEKKQYLSDCASEKLEYLNPFVVVDPENIVNVEEYIPYRTLAVDLSATKPDDFEDFVNNFRTRFEESPFEIVLFKNIDKISELNDRDNWQAMVIKGLKCEDYNCRIDDKILSIPFSKIKVICTCSRYPDYLQERGNLGIGPDFSKL